MIVVTTRVIGTRIDVFSVWERTSGYAGPHSSFFTIGDVLMGKVGARRLPFEIDVLPRGDTRLAAVTAFQQAQYEEAYAAILAEYPQAAQGRRDMGEITIHG